MKKSLMLLCVLFALIFGGLAVAETEYTVRYDEEDALFYRHCYDLAVVHMDKSTREDPEGYYKYWTEKHQSWSDEMKEREKQAGMLFVWPDEQDISRENAIELAYAALEQFGGLRRDMLGKYYPQAVLTLSPKDKHIWRVWCFLANDYYDPKAAQFEVFIDAKTGRIIGFEDSSANN